MTETTVAESRRTTRIIAARSAIPPSTSSLIRTRTRRTRLTYQFRVVPGGSGQPKYNLYPPLSGRLTLPRPRLTLYRDGAPVEAAELIDTALRHLPTHVYVVPQEKGGPHAVEGLASSVRAL